MKNKHIGSTLSSLLDEEGIREEADLRAKEKVLADQALLTGVVGELVGIVAAREVDLSKEARARYLSTKTS